MKTLALCRRCQLAFHTTRLDKASPDCGCLRFGCECRQLREQTKEAA